MLLSMILHVWHLAGSFILTCYAFDKHIHLFYANSAFYPQQRNRRFASSNMHTKPQPAHVSFATESDLLRELAAHGRDARARPGQR